jgi:isoleucyl-tRNA synthetase
VELSSFYLDIIKDRLYCEEKDGLRRRSAQTALFLILDAMAKLFAPILAFTCDEIWQSMPHRDGDDARNVLLNQMPEDLGDYAQGVDMEKLTDLLSLVRCCEDKKERREWLLYVRSAARKLRTSDAYEFIRNTYVQGAQDGSFDDY